MQCQILNHWARPGIEPTTSWSWVRFVSAEPQWELLTFILNRLYLCCLFDSLCRRVPWIPGWNGASAFMQHYCLCWATKEGSDLGRWLYICWFEPEMGTLVSKECKTWLVLLTGKTRGLCAWIQEHSQRISWHSLCVFIAQNPEELFKYTTCLKADKPTALRKFTVEFTQLDGKRPWGL